MFDNHPAMSAPIQSDVSDELARYLLAPCEDVKDGLMWWYEHRHSYPKLSRMARDYLSIPRMSNFVTHFMRLINFILQQRQ